jgi:hypothetical protein
MTSRGPKKKSPARAGLVPLHSGVIRRQLWGIGGIWGAVQLALTISWAPAGPGSILSGTPQGGHKTQTLLAMLHPRLGIRGKGTRGAEVLAFSAPLSLSGLPPA